MGRTAITARHTLHVTGTTLAAPAHNARPRRTVDEMLDEVRACTDRALAILATLDEPAIGPARNARPGKPGGAFILPAEPGTTTASPPQAFPAYGLPREAPGGTDTPRRPAGGYSLPKE